MEKPPTPKRPSRLSGLIQGGLGGPQDELLEDGQEEVFSRTEVESGRVEHQAGGDGGDAETVNGPRTRTCEGLSLPSRPSGSPATPPGARS